MEGEKSQWWDYVRPNQDAGNANYAGLVPALTSGRIFSYFLHVIG